MFSCVGTWGKAIAMSSKPGLGIIQSMWGLGPQGRPRPRTAWVGKPIESVADGLQIFHNPKARFPLSREVFRRRGVVQHFWHDGAWSFEGKHQCLMLRIPHMINVVDDDGTTIGSKE